MADDEVDDRSTKPHSYILMLDFVAATGKRGRIFFLFFLIAKSAFALFGAPRRIRAWRTNSDKFPVASID